MLYEGSCSCQRWQVNVSLDAPLEQIQPRVCDCDYCQAKPSRILSDPKMAAVFLGEGITIDQNGDQLANFYYCESCQTLLAVGCELHGQLRGAINADLLDRSTELAEPLQIQPRLLSADQKLKRWSTLWGTLSGLPWDSRTKGA